jgi:hypothetical protein
MVRDPRFSRFLCFVLQIHRGEDDVRLPSRRTGVGSWNGRLPRNVTMVGIRDMFETMLRGRYGNYPKLWAWAWAWAWTVKSGWWDIFSGF